MSGDHTDAGRVRKYGFTDLIHISTSVTPVRPCEMKSITSSTTALTPWRWMDAMACGKPFLSTDVGCVADLPGGIAVRTGTQLSRALKDLCLDAPRREALGRAGLEACRTSYNWHSVVDAYERLFQHLVRK